MVTGTHQIFTRIEKKILKKSFWLLSGGHHILSGEHQMVAVIFFFTSMSLYELLTFLSKITKYLKRKKKLNCLCVFTKHANQNAKKGLTGNKKDNKIAYIYYEGFINCNSALSIYKN